MAAQTNGEKKHAGIFGAHGIGSLNRAILRIRRNISAGNCLYPELLRSELRYVGSPWILTSET